MNEQLIFQLGAQLTNLQTQIQQLTQALQTHTTQIQETRDSQEALGSAMGLEWSQDVKQWVSHSKLSALKANPRELPSA